MVKLSHGKYSLTIPDAILAQVKRLRELRFISGDTSDNEVKSALKLYQINTGLTVTSLPDQYTLWSLLETNEQ
jgi:hypothetical protein